MTTNIPDLFFQLMTNVFGLDYKFYLAQQGRGFCAFRLPTAETGLQVLSFTNISPQAANALLAAVEKRGVSKTLGGYYTPSIDPTPNSQFAADMLLISAEWQNYAEKQMLGTVYHEGCHCFRESNRFAEYPKSSPALIQARIVRKYTRYAFEDGIGHDEQWFALLLGAAKKLQKQHPHLFGTVRDVVETALHGDRDNTPMDELDWNSLEAMQ